MFIAFEGIEGCGKTTVARMLAEWMIGRGLNPLQTREPGGSELGRELRRVLLDPSRPAISREAELFLFLADRAQHTRDIIRPALTTGRPVICDRFADSTVAYQGYGRGMNLAELEYLNKISTGDLWPDIVFLLDLPVALGLERVKKRLRATGESDEGRFDNETKEFHERIRSGFLEIAAKNPGRVKIIDASASPDEILDKCLSRLPRFPSVA
ncbi:MAG: dTMP kinase [Desulfovibrio sp.]|nr:dTMP kinase [Desulfovibrio sp.]